MDLDDFKDVNTLLGHAGGDALLRLAADALRDAAGDDGVVFRIGGDEFALLPRPDSAVNGRALAERCRRRVRTASRRMSDETDGRLNTSASLGLADWHNGMDAKDLIDAADAALMRGKRRGKNLVTTSDAVFPRDVNTDVRALPAGA